MPTPTISKCAAAVAELIYDAGIRLASESDLLAIEKASPLQRNVICGMYREALGADFEFTVTSLDFAEQQTAEARELAACWRIACEALWGDVDAELWQLQCAARREADPDRWKNAAA